VLGHGSSRQISNVQNHIMLEPPAKVHRQPRTR
jgi:hypothetical protein